MIIALIIFILLLIGSIADILGVFSFFAPKDSQVIEPVVPFSEYQSESNKRWIAEQTATQERLARKQLASQFRALSPADPAVQKLREDARRLHDAGEFKQSEPLLAEAVAMDLASLASQQEAMQKRVASAIATKRLECTSKAARQQFHASADCFANAAEVFARHDPTASLWFRIDQSEQLKNYGLSVQNAAPLRQAIASLDNLLDIAKARDDRQLRRAILLEKQFQLGSLLLLSNDPAVKTALQESVADTMADLTSDPQIQGNGSAYLGASFLDDGLDDTPLRKLAALLPALRLNYQSLAGRDQPEAQANAGFILGIVLVELVRRGEVDLKRIGIEEAPAAMLQEAILLLEQFRLDKSSEMNFLVGEAARSMFLCLASVLLASDQKDQRALRLTWPTCDNAVAKAESAGQQEVLVPAKFFQAVSRMALFDLNGDENSYAEAVDILKTATDQIKPGSYPGYVVQSEYVLGVLAKGHARMIDAGDLQTATDHFRKALELPPGADSKGVQVQAAGALIETQSLLDLIGKADAAALDSAVKFLLAQHEHEQDHNWSPMTRARMAKRAAEGLIARGQFENREAPLREAIAVLNSLAKEVIAAEDAAFAREITETLADAYFSLGRFQVGAPRSGIVRTELLYLPNTVMAVSCGYWCSSAISADPALARGSFDEARRLYQELLETGEFSSEQSRFHLLQELGLSHLGLALAQQFADPQFFSSTEGRAAVAEGARQLRAAVVLMTEEASPSGPIDILFFQQALMLFERFGTLEESRETLHQIRNLYPFEMVGAGSEYAGNILIREAEMDRELGDLVKSEKKFLRGLRILDAHGKGDSREAALARYGLAATLQAQEGRGTEAQQALARAEWVGWQFGLTEASAAQELVSGCGDYEWSLAPGGGLAEALVAPQRTAIP